MTGALTKFRTGAAMFAAAIISLAVIMGEPASAQSQTDRYRLQPGDVILVSVLEDSALDSEALVLPDGRISLPVAGTLTAGGRAPDELAAMIRSRLRSTFVEAPNVTVSVVSVAAPIAEEEEEEIVTAEVYVLGEVASPGRYEYDSAEPITVIEALTLAGGLGPFAARARIQVRERVDGAEALRLFDYESFEEGRLASPADLTNLSDDAVIVVPERRLFE